MNAPVPLAYPPTALRNVAAGLVVGNPIGSSGTRAKALTSVELKAIVEASGISYLPLSGGTLTGPITGTSGLIEQRNGLTAQCLDIFETYTSGTNNGKLRFKATSSGHQIGSARATSGSNRAVQLGHFDAADAFTSAISIATNGAVTVAQSIACGSLASTTGVNCGSGGNGLQLGSNARIYSAASNTIKFWNAAITGAPRLNLGGDTSSFAAIQGTGTTVNFVLADGTGASSVACGAITASGAITPATLTDAAAPNGSIYYSSTASKLVYKDSGGVVNNLY